MIPRTTSLAVLGILALAGAGGCALHDDHDDFVVVDDEPYFATVDSDRTLTTELGSGAGMFVEYVRGGRWRFWTSCDTAVSGLLCDFRLTAYPRGGLVAIDGVDLEPGDLVDVDVDGTFRWSTTTGADSDAIEFEAKPGALLDVELALDGAIDPSYLVWFGNGAVRHGAPRSPVVFQPDAP